MEVDNFPGSCGIDVIKYLSAMDTEKEQLDAFEEAIDNNGFVLISDVVQMEKNRWAEAKKWAIKTTAQKNPNSDNKIRIYIHNRTTIKKWIAAFKRKNRPNKTKTKKRK